MTAEQPPASEGPIVDPDELAQFWEIAKVKLRLNPVATYTGETAASTLIPPAWAFGATPEHADDLLALVLAGTKTGTAGALVDYEADGDEPERPGDLAIILDGRAHPRAVIETTAVSIVPFDQVDAEHARSEGEGDLTLESWREIHERFFTAYSSAGFTSDMPVVCQRFRVLYPTARNA
ncbi:ASCH domain-containing protein [Nostocoides australiense]